MYVHRLRLKSIKALREVDFVFRRRDDKDDSPNLYPGLYVLLGKNASGKTAILKALSCAIVGPNTARILAQSFAGWITKGEPNAEIEADLRHGPEDKFKETGQYPKGPFSASLQLKEEQPEPTLSHGGEKRKRTAQRGPWAENPDGWFACGYGPFRRVTGTSPEAMRKVTGPIRVARFASLFDEAAALTEGQLWLKEIDHQAHEGHEGAKQLRDRIITLLNDGLFPETTKVVDISYKGIHVQDAAGFKIEFSELSEGYRTSLALVIDIIRLMCLGGDFDVIRESPPKLLGLPGDPVETRNAPGKLVVDREGVVLIDELDAHLHPEWQQAIGRWLKERFPLVQFIVTTHSPFVARSADRVFLLDARTARQIQLDEQTILRKGTIDQVLTSSAFGLESTRTPEMREIRLRLATLVQRSKQTQLRLKDAEELVSLQKEVELAIEAQASHFSARNCRCTSSNGWHPRPLRGSKLASPRFEGPQRSRSFTA